MKRLPTSLSLCLLLLLSMLLPAFAQVSQDSQLVSLGVDLVNSDRRQNGVAPVRQSQALSRVAQTYANYLARTGFFGHLDPFGRNPEDRARYLGVQIPVSENLAWATSSFEDGNALLRREETGMMNEPPNQHNHRFNILNPDSNYVGIGVARIGNKVVMVQEYTSQSPD